MTEKVYLADIRNRNTGSINDTMAGVLTYLQESYVLLIPHEFLEREYIIKKKIYNPR